MLDATVSVAESATGGMLGERFTSAPGSSQYFLGGFITYNNAMKMELLGVTPEILKEHGAVSQEPLKPWPSVPPPHQVHLRPYPSPGVAGPEVRREDSQGTMYVASPMPPDYLGAQAIPGGSPRIRYLRRTDGAGSVAPPHTGGVGRTLIICVRLLLSSQLPSTSTSLKSFASLGRGERGNMPT